MGEALQDGFAGHVQTAPPAFHLQNGIGQQDQHGHKDQGFNAFVVVQEHRSQAQRAFEGAVGFFHFIFLAVAGHQSGGRARAVIGDQDEFAVQPHRGAQRRYIQLPGQPQVALLAAECHRQKFAAGLREHLFFDLRPSVGGLFILAAVQLLAGDGLQSRQPFPDFRPAVVALSLSQGLAQGV